jgi:hypothetical protein
LGDVGTPNTYSHLGGILGALTVVLCVKFPKTAPRPHRPDVRLVNIVDI